MLRSLRLVALLALAGCGDDPASPADPDPAPARPEAPPRPPEPPPPLEGLEGLEVEPTEDEVAPRAGLTEASPGEDRSCVIASETRTVLEHAGRTAVAAGPSGQLAVAAYLIEGEGEAVAIARVRPDAAPELVTHIPLEGRVAVRGAPPGVSVSGATLLVAVTDGQGRVLVADVDLSLGAVAGGFAVRIEDAHADARFAPVVLRTPDGTRVVAWTDGSGTPMRVRLSRIGPTGEVLSTSVISPDGGGAAPVLGAGETERALYVVEARVAMSAAHRVTLGEDGTPSAPSVARPLLRGADLPAIAVVRAPAGTRTHLAYAAVGNLATRAVGLVQTTGTDSPLPLVPGLGYGAALSVRATALERAVVFAMDAPSAADPAAPHEVRVRVAGDDGAIGPPLVLAGHGAPDVARVGELIGLGTEGARVTFLRCRE